MLQRLSVGTAIFLENLFRAFGHDGVRQAGATLEQRIARRDNGGTAYADLEWKPRVLIEMKGAGREGHGVATVRISRIERGVREVRLTTMLRLLEALEISPQVLLRDASRLSR